MALVFAANPATAVGSRLVTGVAQAAVSVGATGLAVELAPEARRGEAASYILVCFHLGLALGPRAGEAIQSATSYQFAWLVFAVLWALGGVVATRLPRAEILDAPKPAWMHRAGLLPGTVLALGNVAFAAFSVFIPLCARVVGLASVGIVFTVASFSIAATRILLRRLPDRWGPIRAGSDALMVTATGAAAAAVWQTPTGVFVAVTVLAAGMALQTPSLIPVALRGVAPHERASALATFTMFMDVSVAVTGPVFGFVVSAAGYRTAFGAAAVLAVAGLVVLRVTLAPRWDRAAPGDGPT